MRNQDPGWKVRPSEAGAQLVVDPRLAENLINQVSERYQAETERGSKPVLVCAAQIRMPLRRMLRMSVPGLPILSYTELSVSTVAVHTLGMIDDLRTPVGHLVP